MNKVDRMFIALFIVVLVALGILFSLETGSNILMKNHNTIELEPVINQEAEVENTAASQQTTNLSDTGIYEGNMLSSINETASVECKEPVFIEYKGAIRHIFFHPLIIYPEIAFDGDSLSEGYNDWFVTVKEFKKILDSLYAKDYILVDMSKLYEITEQDGKSKIVKKKLMLPEGKKPLIISVDDINYYDYMKENGNAHKLVINAEGNVAAYSISPDGQENIECDNEIVPIIDKFVKQHPDFSLESAKGILALTGYAGILGYHTEDADSLEYGKEKEEASKVVERLKETGWSFACHGYGHLHSKKVSLDRLKKDTVKWKAEVEAIVGPTGIYIYPYGEEIPVRDPKFQMLMSEGFKIFCPVGNTGFQIVTGEYVQMDRMNIDGFAFNHRKEKLSDMFDVDNVVDDIRPSAK